MTCLWKNEYQGLVSLSRRYTHWTCSDKKKKISNNSCSRITIYTSVAFCAPIQAGTKRRSRTSPWRQKKKKKKTRLTKEREKSTLERVLTNESHIQRILALLETAGARIKNPSLERMKQRLQCHHEITAEDRIGCLLLEMLDVLYSEGQRRFVLGWTCTGWRPVPATHGGAPGFPFWTS